MDGVSSKKLAELEALLFYYGEPIAIGKAAKLLGVKEAECEGSLNELEQNLREDSKRGLMLLRQGYKFQMVTKPDFKDINDKLIREEFREELTPAALEALSIIAYLGPIPRSTVDYVRGVNSSFTLRNLLMRGLVERSQSSKKNVYDYRVSFDFLKHMGLGRIEELPEYDKYKNILQQFETQTTDQ